MRPFTVIAGLLLSALSCLGETIDGARLTVVNAPIARIRLGISNSWVIALGTNSVQIAAGLNVTVVTNVTASNVIYTISASTNAGGGNINSNANQFLGDPLSIKHNAQLSNVMVWPSNNLTTSLVVTSTPGSTANLLEAQNTNRTGLVIGSNGLHSIRASVTGTTPTLTLLNLGANQTYTVWSNSFAGNGSFIMRTDNAGNAVFSPGNAGGETYFGGPDSGSGIVNFSLTTVGSVWRMIPSSAVATWHGSTLRRGQLSNVWDFFVRSNIVYSELNGGADTISLLAPSSIVASFALTWPHTNGLAGQTLYNDGTGVLGWKDDSGAAAGANNQNQFYESGSLAATSRWAIVRAFNSVVISGVDGLGSNETRAKFVVTNDSGSRLEMNAAGLSAPTFIQFNIGPNAANYGSNVMTLIGGVGLQPGNSNDLALGGATQPWKELNAQTNRFPFYETTNDFVLNQYYTNSYQRSWVGAAVSLTNVVAGDKSQVALYLDQDASGAFERTGLETRLQGVALASATTELSAWVQPGARFLFTNLTTGGGAAAIVANSSQWIRH